MRVRLSSYHLWLPALPPPPLPLVLLLSFSFFCFCPCPCPCPCFCFCFCSAQDNYFQDPQVDRANVGSIETALMRCDATDSAIKRYDPLVDQLEDMAKQVDEAHAAHEEMTSGAAAAREAHKGVADKCAELRDGESSSSSSSCTSASTSASACV